MFRVVAGLPSFVHVHAVAVASLLLELQVEEGFVLELARRAPWLHTQMAIVHTPNPGLYPLC